LVFSSAAWLGYSYNLITMLSLCLDVNQGGKIVTAAHRDL